LIDYVGRGDISGGSPVTKLTFHAAIAGILFGIADCVSPQQQVAQKEDLLAAA